MDVTVSACVSGWVRKWYEYLRPCDHLHVFLLLPAHLTTINKGHGRGKYKECRRGNNIGSCRGSSKGCSKG